jgi:assimilatory nitrate reductase catalytic subunit
MMARETRSTCPYCGVGCGVIIQSQGNQITGVRGDPEHPANRGRLCTKGQTLHLSAAPLIQQQRRLQQPLRRAARGEPLNPVTWDDALDDVADRLANIVQEHGPDAIGLYVSGQLLTEDYYVFNKLAKGLLGTNNIDTNSRLCMSSAVAGYKASLGADAPPACYEDIAHAQTVFIAGSNMAWAHPVLMRRLEDAKRANPAQRWIVADPRRTETAAAADLHLPLLPGTDVMLFHAMLHVMLWEGLVDHAFIEAHTKGFAELRDRVREFTPAHAAKVCGLKADDIVQAARWFAGVDGLTGGASGGVTGGVSSSPLTGVSGGAATGAARTPTLSLYCQGLNQSSSGTDKNRSLINLHLACGQIGKLGAGPFSLTGQPNAMGGREVGGLCNLLSAHRDLSNAAHRAEVAALWGVPEVPAARGKSAVEMFQAAADGEIKALWIVCTNPAQSMPDQTMVRRALARAELVVLQEAYAGTATAAYADIVLPARSWGEKEGTVTNSERCISRVRAAVNGPGEARDDWAIAVAVARRLETRLASGRSAASARGAPVDSLSLRERARVRAAGSTLAAHTLFPYSSAESIWNEHRESTRGRDLDITGLSYAALEQQPRQWPCPSGASQGQARLYTDNRFATADAKAVFAAPAWRPTAEVRDARFPVSLTTGRLRDQWHGMSRTGVLGRLFAHSPEPAIELHPQELARRHWTAGQLVRVKSRRGELVLPVQASEALVPAQAFIAMHWGSEFVSGLGVNALTPADFCAQSMQPELKHAAVRIEDAELPWQLIATAWLPPDQTAAAREALRDLFGQFAFASCVPFGREPEGGAGLLFRAAARVPASAELLGQVEAALGLADSALLRYADTRGGQRRLMALRDDGSLRAFVLAGDTRAQHWVLALLQQGRSAAAFGRALLAASAEPPQPVAPRSPQVCACHDVSEDRIVAALAHSSGSDEDRLHSLRTGLRCGTECGSCLPALRQLVRAHAAVAARV